MCGILGLYDTRKGGAAPERHNNGVRMAAAIAHRGPDDRGLWQDPDHALLLGQCRLAIIDLSPQGHQPMESGSGRYVITFNGEIYNFQSLQKELEQAGVKFRGRSDTEVMLAAFDQYGVNIALQKIRGMFAFVLWDKKSAQLHLARDRLGKKPLYVGWAGDTLVFGSELKALRAHPDFNPQISRRAMASYLRFGHVSAPFSIFENVWQLLPGSRMSLDLRNLSPRTDLSVFMEPYWNPRAMVDAARGAMNNAPEGDVVAQFESLLTDCVRERMISDVPLGAFLSGGIDSSAVVALMQRESARPVKTFTIGFQERGFDEAAHAREIAAHLGTEHHEAYLTGKDALDVVPLLPAMYDEPFSDSSQIPTYLVSKFARAQVTVALSGDGGDELLGGYNRHIVLPALWSRAGWLPLSLRKKLAATIRRKPAAEWSRMFPQIPNFGEKASKIAAVMDEDSAEHAYASVLTRWGAPADALNGTESLLPAFDPAWLPAGLNFAERMMYGDMIGYLPNDVLTKVDRASMAVALEARAPLLDSRMFEFAWSLPLKYKIRNGRGKWLLREVLKSHVPENLFDRPKQGFSVPVAAWLRGPLRPWAEDMLDITAMRDDGLMNPQLVRATWREFLDGKDSHADRMWTVLMFQSWKKTI